MEKVAKVIQEYINQCQEISSANVATQIKQNEALRIKIRILEKFAQKRIDLRKKYNDDLEQLDLVESRELEHIGDEVKDYCGLVADQRNTLDTMRQKFQGVIQISNADICKMLSQETGLEWKTQEIISVRGINYKNAKPFNHTGLIFVSELHSNFISDKFTMPVQWESLLNWDDQKVLVHSMEESDSDKRNIMCAAKSWDWWDFYLYAKARLINEDLGNVQGEYKEKNWLFRIFYDRDTEFAQLIVNLIEKTMLANKGMDANTEDNYEM